MCLYGLLLLCILTSDLLLCSESCSLARMDEQAKRLRAHGYKRAKALIRQIDRQEFLQGEKKKKPKASCFRINGQRFILAACPKNRRQARTLFEKIRKEKATVFVSALQSKEAKSRFNNFWRKKNLRKITLPHGKKIETISKTVIACRKSSRKVVPQVIERTLRDSYGHLLHHLHYDGWKDKRGMPSKGLLMALLDRIEKRSLGFKVPVAIHCKSGVGRSGTIAVSLYLRRIVKARLAAGKKLHEIKIDIPKVILAFRKHRRHLIGTPAQLAQIYSVLALYYKRIKEKKAAR